MKKCLIFSAAEFDDMIRDPEPEDMIIAADGGLRHLQKKKLTPNVVLGDFDSLTYIPEDALVYPEEKDDTDTMLAVRLGLSRGYREFVIYGGLDGPRIDHTVANFQTLQYLADHDACGYLVGREQLVTVVKDGMIRFPAGVEGTVSIFCMGPDARGVTLRGLKYPFENGRLTAGFPLGVSNQFRGTRASIRVTDGSLLVIWERKNGFPVRVTQECLKCEKICQTSCAEDNYDV